MIELEARGSRATVEAAAGGRVASWTVADADGADHSLLLPTDRAQPLLGGCYPMVPWAGRLRDGKLRFGGVEHGFPAVLAPPHAIHGTALTVPWEVEAS